VIYRSPVLYNLLMRVLYGKHFTDRYQVVSKEIPDGASVLDVCCGDCFLYRRFLQARNVRYIGVDNSPAFICSGQRKKIDVRSVDLKAEELPKVEYVVMQGSLYQFLPDAAVVLKKLRAAATIKVIVAEPVQNLSDSHVKCLAKFSRWLTTPYGATNYSGERFSEESFTRIIKEAGGAQQVCTIPGGREMVALLDPETVS